MQSKDQEEVNKEDSTANNGPTSQPVPSWSHQIAPQTPATPDTSPIIRPEDIAFIVSLSALSIVGGIFLILIPLGFVRISSSFVSSSNLDGSLVNTLLVAVGVFLVVSPLFLNQFVFSGIRHERELRVRAQKRTREAQLLQDILTHDIRNYNQVSQLSAELLKEELAGNKQVRELLDQLLESIGGSTTLVERAKMLGRVISDSNLELRPVNVLESIQHSIMLVSGSNPEKHIDVVVRLGNSPAIPLKKIDTEHAHPKVLADNLIDQVFVNLFSNSAKYTEGKEVFLSIDIREEYDRKAAVRYWRMSIADLGPGIPDEIKPKLFSRYLSGSKSSGLGLSIVHALVVERFNGKIAILDRDKDGTPKGTLVEIWLRKA